MGCDGVDFVRDLVVDAENTQVDLCAGERSQARTAFPDAAHLI